MAMTYHFSNEQYTIGIWKIEESEAYYREGIDFTSFDTLEYEAISNETKRMEWLASRFLLKKISNETKQLELRKHDSGRPFFNNISIHFSLSHSGGFVAAIISPYSKVAIDIEVPTEKVLRIEQKYTNQDDYCIQIFPRSIEDMTIVWSAKETVYKFYDIPGLSLKNNMSIDQKSSEHLYTKVQSNHQIHQHLVHWLKIEKLIVTYMISPPNELNTKSL
jgi:phosphopantetheinyl transferase